jgi:hypothetical protein
MESADDPKTYIVRLQTDEEFEEANQLIRDAFAVDAVDPNAKERKAEMMSNYVQLMKDGKTNQIYACNSTIEMTQSIRGN